MHSERLLGIGEVGYIVFNATFNNISFICSQFYGRRKPEYPLKTTDFRESLTNCIEYPSTMYTDFVK